jgi:hypothetical protein
VLGMLGTQRILKFTAKLQTQQAYLQFSHGACDRR